MADGSVVRASADENPDLFWAIRGGGGNFGIAASLEYDLHPVGPIITGGARRASAGSEARDVLRFFRDTCATLPDEVMLVAGLLTAPDGSGAKLVGMLGRHCGSLADGEAAVTPIKAFGPPVMDAMGPMPYCAQNSLLDRRVPEGRAQLLEGAVPHRAERRRDRTLVVERSNACPSPMSQIVIEHFHGAASRVPVAATACAMRVTGFNVVIISQWLDPRDTERGMQWAATRYAALQPYLAPMRYVNYLRRR